MAGCSSILLPYHENFEVKSNGDRMGYGGSVNAIYKLTLHPNRYVVKKQPKKYKTYNQFNAEGVR